MTEEVRSPIARMAALSIGTALLALGVVAVSYRPGPAASRGEARGPSPSSNGAISPQDQADALHFIIAADRELICRIQGPAPGAGTAEGGPSPCELLRRSAESIQSSGAEFSFALRSLHPGDPRNGPQTEVERQGLAYVAEHPKGSFCAREMLGGRRYVTAVYPDLPATSACVACHERRGAPANHPCKVGESMGGIVVRVPLEF